MPGLINFGNGIAAMGASIADTAGQLGLTQQKADLENQKLVLADQLQQGRDKAQFAQQDKTVAAQEAGATGRTRMSEEGANTRNTATINGENTRNTATIAGENTRAAAAEKGANARNAASIAAQDSELNFDADGRAIIINKQTGKSTPLVSADGKTPLQLANPAQAKFASDAINATRDDLRWTTSQYDTAVREAQNNLDAVRKSSGNDDDVTAAQKQVDAVKAQYAPHIQELQQRLSGLAASLMTRANIPGPAPAPGARPPLASFAQPEKPK